MARCYYCGQTVEHLLYNNMEICNCCGHCTDCKLLVTVHEVENTTTEPAEEHEDDSPVWGQYGNYNKYK